MKAAIAAAVGGFILLAVAAIPHVFVDGTEQAVQHWLSQHEGYVQEARQGGVDLLFLGDSLTFAWRYDGHDVWEADFAPQRAAAFGIGGDHTGDVVWRVEHGELEGLNPRTVVLEIGTNDLGAGVSIEATAQGIDDCIRAVRAKLPKAMLVVLGIFPRGSGGADTPARREIAAVNALASKFDDGKHVRFVDLTAAFVDHDGVIRPELFHPDLVHLSSAGYSAWSNALRPALAHLHR